MAKVNEDFLFYDMYYVNPYTTEFIHVKRRPSEESQTFGFDLFFFLSNNFYNLFLTFIDQLNETCWDFNMMKTIDAHFSSNKIIGPSHDVLSNLAKRVPVIDMEFYLKEDKLLGALQFIYFLFDRTAGAHLRTYIQRDPNINYAHCEGIIDSLGLRDLFMKVCEAGFETHNYL